ncbi:MAG: HAD family phosphatase [Bacteroidetes bacterium]|nr:HAD family phosphatase [Bacteroidota bacterium]
MELTGIKNLIFDLGNVLIDIDPKLSTEMFKKLGVHQIDEIYSLKSQNDLFDNLEMGKISNDDFRNEIRHLSNSNLTDDQIDLAWSAMLLELPHERLELLADLKKRFRIFLLSNTNAIHIKSFNERLNQQNRKDFFYDLFDHVYYSYEIGMRKPNADIYNHLLDDQSIVAEECLFIDDLQHNIDGAAQLNFKTQLVEKDILDLF